MIDAIVAAGPGLFVAGFGLLWILFPHKMFYVRNWPAVEKDREMTDAGASMYELTGFLFVVTGLGLAVVLATR